MSETNLKLIEMAVRKILHDYPNAKNFIEILHNRNGENRLDIYFTAKVSCGLVESDLYIPIEKIVEDVRDEIKNDSTRTP